MHSTQTRAQLLHCRAVLAKTDASNEMRRLAYNLIDHLLEMHEAKRMRVDVLLLALESLELVPGMDECVAQLRATATRHSASGV